MEKLLGALIDGVAFGCVYALLAVGLTLAYKTSGVFNIAFGTQAFASGAIYYQLKVNENWGIVPSFVVAVLIVAPAIGIILDRFLFRYLRSAPPMARLITALGLLVAIPQIVLLWFDETSATNPVGIVPNGRTVYHVFGAALDRNQLSIMISAAAVAIGLTLLFRYTALGIRMRAVVESPRMAELAGTDSDRVSTSSWVMSSLVAGLAGVLLPTVTGQVGDIYYTTLLTAAIAAVVLAGLTSIPIAFGGAIGLGVIQELLNRYLPTNSVLASNLRPSLPFVVLFLVLILSPRLRNRKELTDPLSTVDPPPPAPAHGQRSRELTIGTRVAAVLFLGGVGYYVFFHGNASVVGQGIQMTIYAIIFCSIVVITGIAGEVSFAQATFAGIGGFASAQLSSSAGMSVILTIIIGGLMAAAIGAMLAVPALRLGGIFLTLATYAFALFFDNVIVSLSWVSGGLFPVVAPRPQIGSIDFASDKSYLGLCLVILVIVGVVVILVRNGTTGRYLSTVRGSEVAAASVGINPTRARIVAFALSAGIAGIGGALLASYEGHANKIDYSATLGLFWVVIVVTLGPRTVEGAIQAAIGFVIFPARVLTDWLPWIINHIQPFFHVNALPIATQFIFFGLGAVTYARHPEGVLEANKGRSLAKIQSLIDRFKRGSTPPSGPTPEVVAAGGSGRWSRQWGSNLVSLLEAVGVTKTFAGITALDAVNLDVKEGEVVGLIGPNGAGKTTFFNCLLGILKPDDGKVVFDGRDLSRVATHRRARLGIGRTFQRIELFAGMTPHDHFFVAERVRNGSGALWKDVLGLGGPSADERKRVDAMLELLGLTAVADRPIESLSLGVGRLVEIGRALMTEPKLVLLDEPSSGLDRHETETLAGQLREVQQERGFAILLVEHDVEFVRSLVERVFVLDFGTLIASGLTDDVFADSAVRKAYLGDTV